MHPLMTRLAGALLACAACATAAQAATYKLNDFTVVDNGSTLFSDSFDDGIRPAPPAYFYVSPGLPADAEAGGQLSLNPAFGDPFGAGRSLILSPTSGFDSPLFNVTGRFAPIAPLDGEDYFVTLHDITRLPNGSLVTSPYLITVLGFNGQTFVTFVSVDNNTAAVTLLGASGPIDLSGHDQIALSFDRGEAGLKARYQFLGGSLGDGALQDLGVITWGADHAGFATSFGAFGPAPAIPEPGTWAMLLLGLAAVAGTAVRSRHAQRG